MKNFTLIFLSILMSCLGDHGKVSARTLTVTNGAALVDIIGDLANGDTLYLSSGNYNISAPNGLILATRDFSPYANVSIIGAGMDKTIIDFTNSQYGFFAYYSENLLIKNLTVTNASLNGGLYCKSSSVNLDSLKFESCSASIFSSKTAAYGGGVFYDEDSKFSFIHSCVFINNEAATSGGGLAFLNESYLYPETLNIEQCVFQGNEATTAGSALYVKGFYTYLYLTDNAFYENKTVPALSVNAEKLSSRARLFLKNNTISLNDAGGVSIGTYLRTYLYLNNNAIVDNELYDLKSTSGATQYQGNFNVAETLSGIQSFTGNYNSVVVRDSDLFVVVNDSLKPTMAAYPVLAARVSASAINKVDLYGDTVVAPGDIGAINLPLDGKMAVWTGRFNQEFTRPGNWKDSISPDASIDFVLISDCSVDAYPLISSSTDVFNGGDLTGKSIYVTPTGILANQGEIKTDSVILLSLEGGVGQLFNEGNITDLRRKTQKFVKSGVWTPLYVADSTLAVSDLIDGATYGVDYKLTYFDEGAGDYKTHDGASLFDNNKGYFVKTTRDVILEWNLVDHHHDNFLIQYTEMGANLNTGFNLIGNPYAVAIEADKLRANTGNSENAAGAVYCYENNRLKVWVAGLGDTEAEIIDPAESFFVQALDKSDQAVSQANYITDLANANLVKSSSIDETLTSLEGGLKIQLGTSSLYYENAYVRFDDAATFGFDYTMDAMKLGRLEGTTPSLLYTQTSDADVDYAVNSLRLEKDTVISVPLVVDFVTLTSPQSRRFKFEISGGADISYLFHDATKDKSESVILTNNKVVYFTTGTDVQALKDRFSIEVFAGDVPQEVVAYEEIGRSEGYEIQRVKDYDTTLTVETNTFFEGTDTSFVGDTIFAYELWGDSIITEMTVAWSELADSVVYDTAFVDTTRLLGTYQYIEHDTVVYTSIYHSSNALTSPKKIREIEVKRYTLIDTLLSTGVNPVLSEEKISIVTKDRAIQIKSADNKGLTIRVYNLSGQMLAMKRLWQGSGFVEVTNPGVYIIRVEKEGEVMSRKVLVE